MAPRSLTVALLGLLVVAASPAPPGGAARELLVENSDRGTVLCVPLGPGEVFSVVSQHSMYDQPVTEDFELDEQGRIVLQAVTSPSAAVREYFGISAAVHRQAMAHNMNEIAFRIATGT